MKKGIAIVVVLICAILACIGGVEAWNNWTPITIHEVQSDGAYYYAPVANHDINNNSPLLISSYLIWKNETWNLPIYKDDSGNDFLLVTKDTSGNIFIEVKIENKIKKHDIDIGIPILNYSDPHLGEDILNLPVLGSTQTELLLNSEEPFYDFYIMMPLKNYPEGKESYVAYLIEELDPPNKNNNHDWIIPLFQIPINSSENINYNEKTFLYNGGNLDIQMDLGLVLSYVSLNTLLD